MAVSKPTKILAQPQVPAPLLDGRAPVPSSFTEFMRARIGANWVLARRTSRIVARYGEGVVCLTPKHYKALRDEFDAAQPERRLCDAAPKLLAIAHEVLATLYERAGPENEHLTDRETELWHAARAAIAEVTGYTKSEG